MVALLGNPNPGVKPVVYTGIQIQTSSQGIPVPVLYGTSRVTDNLIWYGGFVAAKVKSGGKGGALGGAAGKNGPVSYRYSANVIFGVCEGPIQGFGQVWASKVPTSLSALNLTSFLGTYPQAAWGFMTTSYPAEARPYSGLAYLGANPYSLGASADIPTHTFEVYGVFSNRIVYTTATIPSSAPYTITVGSRVWADTTTKSMWVSNVSIPGYVAVGGAPAAGQYSVAAGVYTFNAANAGASVTIGWNGKGQDADPSLVVTDILTNAYYGVGFPSARVGELNAYSEDSVIPGGLTISVVHAATFDDNLSVYVAVGDVLFTCVAASPGPLQYTYSTAGLYTFNAADVGKTVSIAYVSNDGLVTFQNYAWAAGLFISPAYVQQAAASSVIEEIAKLCNSEVVWSSGALKIVPRGDLTITANGHTYTAPSGTVKDLSDSDYQVGGSGSGGSSGSPTSDPLLVTRKRVADQKNVVQLECLDRTYQYNVALLECTDQAAVDLYGRRTSGSISAHIIADLNTGKTVAQLLLQREAILNGYAFSLDARYVWLDPMDIVSVSDSALGLTSASYVRIMEINEQEDGSLSFRCEDYPDGVANSESYAYGSNSGYATNYNVDPGSVNLPTLFEPSVQLATNTGLEVWCAVSGADANWGGADVYVSTDGGVSYNFIARQWGAARMGFATSGLNKPRPFAGGLMSSVSRRAIVLGSMVGGFGNGTLGAWVDAGAIIQRRSVQTEMDVGPVSYVAAADPDTIDILSVDLTESFGTLISATAGDADLGNSVCLIDSEMISFSTVALTGAYKYNLTTYIRRGQFGTTIAAHAANAPFARLDEQIFTFPYDKTQIGQTVYVKFCSFNIYGGGLQDISVVTAYPHLIVGPPLPGTVLNFAVNQQGGPVVFTWDDLPDFVLKGYDILYGPTSGTVAGATFLTTASRATEMTHANVPPGTWTFYIRGHDLADQVGAASSVTFTVLNYNYLIATQFNEPDWFGTLTQGVRHYSGSWVPQGQNFTSTYGWEAFDQFVPDPFALPTYEGLELDSGADGEMRILLITDVDTATSYGETAAPAFTAQLKYKTSTGAYSAYADWVSGSVTARYATAKLTLDTTVDEYATMFDVLFDNPPNTQTLQNQAIDAAGTAVLWQVPFRNIPNVQVTPAAAGATGGAATNITATGATIKLYNGGAAVSGVANIFATGA